MVALIKAHEELGRQMRRRATRRDTKHTRRLLWCPPGGGKRAAIDDLFLGSAGPAPRRPRCANKQTDLA